MEGRVSHEFEDIFHEEDKSQRSMSMNSVGVGNNKPTNEQATDVKNLVGHENFSCNTNVQTDEK